MRQLIGKLLLLCLALAPAAARADVILRLNGPAPAFDDLSKLTVEEAEANRYGRHIPLGRLQIEVYLTLSETSDTNVRPEVRACISAMNNQIPESPDDPVLESAPGCEVHDYSRYRWFDYGDPTPDASDFGLSRTGMVDPVIGTLLNLSLSPPGAIWNGTWPSGMYLKGSNQFNPNDSKAAFNPSDFRSGVIYRMDNEDGLARLEIFLPSIISKNFTGRNTPFGFPPSVIEIGSSLDTDYLLRQGEVMQGSPIYQTPLCANIIDRIPTVVWTSYTGIDMNAAFEMDDTTLNPPNPTILRTTMATRFANQTPTPEEQRDFSIDSLVAPALGTGFMAGEANDSILVPLGVVRLTEERAEYLYPVILTDATHAPFYPRLSIIPTDGEVRFASTLMTRPLNFYATDTPPNAAFGPGAEIDLIQGPEVWSAEIKKRLDDNTGEMRFQAGLVRVPRSRAIEAVTTDDPARRCLNFILRLEDYCEECKTIQRIETEVPLVCFNPATAER